MNRYKTMIFDMDGTLLNTLDDIADSVNHIMRVYGFPERTLDEVRCFVGNGARRLMELVIPGGDSHPQFDQIRREYEAYYQAHCQIKTAPYQGILETLEKLKEKGIKMAIVSNKGDGAVKELADQYFGDSVSAAQGVREGIRRKPAPDAVLEALKYLDSTPQEAIYVGDSEVDYKTASNAGMDCVLVSWGFRSREQLQQLSPDYLIDRPEQLLTLLQ